MANHPSRSKPKFCKWCEADWPVCYDRNGNRFHVGMGVRTVQLCAAIRTRDDELKILRERQ